MLTAVVRGAVSVAEATAQGLLAAEPDTAPLDQLLEFLDSFDFWFNIVEP